MASSFPGMRQAEAAAVVAAVVVEVGAVDCVVQREPWEKVIGEGLKNIGAKIYKSTMPVTRICETTVRR